MPEDTLLVRVRALWTAWAGVPVSFRPDGQISVVTAPRSRLCPAAWVGIVVLGRAAIVTAPTEPVADLLQDVLADLPLHAITDVDQLNAVLPMTDVLGPAALAYLDAASFRPARDCAIIEELPSAEGDLDVLLTAAGQADAGESGLAEVTSPAFIVRDRGVIIAAAGYRLWSTAVAHLCVLTAPRWRGQGLARAVASAATAHALSHALLPQWRARPPASRRVAAMLGFQDLGTQLSIKLAAEPKDNTSRHEALPNS